MILLPTAQELEQKLDAEHDRVASVNAELNQTNCAIERLRILMDDQAKDDSKALAAAEENVSTLTLQLEAFKREHKKLESEHDSLEIELKERLKELQSVQKTLAVEREELEVVATRGVERESALKSQLQKAFDATETKDQV